ncbi:DEAD/DEAH box helicase family protein [Bacillaceae bacterium IKA-2]|nr:DEAD/DEAH box helicase family protein [Bacillaceae bacterium IKA-2]
MIRVPNGEELFDFQKEASEWLLNNSGPDSDNQLLIMKAPTGSGKTVILLNYIDDYLNFIGDKTAFVWLSIGSGELEEQSKTKMDYYLPDRSSKTLEDTLLSGFKAGDVTFINWESVTKKGNRALKYGEMKNIKDRIAEAHKAGLNFIIIVDEEHLNKTAKAQDFIDNFSADNMIRVSATTIKNDSAKSYEISEAEVIASGLITSAMYVNDGVDVAKSDINTEYEYLLDLAISKRNEIHSEYEELNKNIRPLVLIQFPNASEELVTRVEHYLEEKGYSYKNNFLAKWLAEEKINIDGIEKMDATPEFLICKQAISTGWDCPRAKILVKLRENMTEQFETQTIGRIRRMPEAKHYDNDILDNCFMYTFDEDYKDAVLNEGNAFERKEVFIKLGGKELILIKQVRDTASQNYGQREVRSILSKYLVNKYKLKKDRNLEAKEYNMKKLEADSWVFGTQIDRIYKKGKFVKISDLIGMDPTKHASISYEVNTHTHGRDVMHNINELHKIISISDSVVRSIVKTLFHKKEYRRADNLLALDNREWYAFIINNRNRLKDLFYEVKSQGLQVNENSEQIELAFFKEREFKIPLSEVYRFDSQANLNLFGEDFESNVYDGYQKNMVTDKTRSGIEQKFENYCEDNSNVEWYYKNGDKGDKYLSIAYRDGVGKIRLFYPDYIVKLQSGDIWSIETKGGERSGQSQNIDKLAEIKFDAFKEYARRHKEINWGFVRDLNNQLFINKTKYSEVIYQSEEWKLLKDNF